MRSRNGRMASCWRKVMVLGPTLVLAMLGALAACDSADENLDQPTGQDRAQAYWSHDVGAILDRYTHFEGRQVVLDDEAFDQLSAMGAPDDLLTAIDEQLSTVNSALDDGSLSMDDFDPEPRVGASLYDTGSAAGNSDPPGATKGCVGKNSVRVKWYGVVWSMDSCKADLLLGATSQAVGASGLTSWIIGTFPVSWPVAVAVAAVLIVRYAWFYYVASKGTGVKIIVIWPANVVFAAQ